MSSVYHIEENSISHDACTILLPGICSYGFQLYNYYLQIDKEQEINARYSTQVGQM